MAPGALDPLTKEMLYLAVSATNGCDYCIASHTASARRHGMTDEMLGELLAVVGMANETNRLANGYQVEIDEAFRTPVAARARRLERCALDVPPGIERADGGQGLIAPATRVRVARTVNRRLLTRARSGGRSPRPR